MFIADNRYTNDKNFKKKRRIDMKATGIVRRIDDLGRVVIPKEIRRTLRIREGDPLEIFTNNEGEVIFKKYSSIGEINEAANSAAEVIYKLGGAPVVVFDRDHVVAVAGTSKKEYSERRVSAELEDLIESRSTYIKNGDKFMPIEGVSKPALAITPIISSGDVTGAVAFVEGESEQQASEKHLMLTKAAAMFLGKQIES